MGENGTATAPKLRHGIAEEVRVLLARKRMSATKLAHELGWTQQYMSRRMVGDQAFDADDMERMAEALEVGVIDLLPRAEREREATQWYPAAAGASRYAAWPKHPIIAASVPIPLPRPPGVRRTAPTGA